MAYVLGFFTADGSMTKNKRGSHFIEFQITDKELLEKIRDSLSSNHKISIRKNRVINQKVAYKLQIGSKEIFNDLLKLGLSSKKSKRIKLPNIPKKYFSHFVRGYFDGDGNVTVCNYRRNNNDKFSTTIQSGFVSGCRSFLQSLKDELSKLHIIKGGTLYYSNNGWRLFFSINDSKNFYHYIYDQLGNNLFLNRKKKIFEEYWGRSSIG